ncbi:MAG: DUF4846 domain-containing protein [Rhizobacter sp.]|nr:DUF4846 domain-containing protein [Chlorobiales bacterium]
MKKRLCIGVAVCLVNFGAVQTLAAQGYTWLGGKPVSESIETRFAPPAGFTRVDAAKGSFAAWLRGLPLKQGTPEVFLFSGKKKENQTAQAAVIEIDTGTRDLQQCADAVMRLRAEYLFANGRQNDIHFKFTNGSDARYEDWRKGGRPKIQGAKAVWRQVAAPDTGYKTFRKYLDVVFTYAGSASLEKELMPVKIEDVEIGDVFIQGGYPGHAVMVVDVATEKISNKKMFLIAQSYMPAQDIHILKNPASQNAWYSSEFTSDLETPEWTFRRTDSRRFK